MLLKAFGKLVTPADVECYITSRSVRVIGSWAWSGNAVNILQFSLKTEVSTISLPFPLISQKNVLRSSDNKSGHFNQSKLICQLYLKV